MSQQIGDTMTEAYNDRNRLRSEALRHHLKKVNATAGTLHHIHPSQTYLMLVVAVGLPSDLLTTIEEITIGKGLAGLAWMRESVVSSCNLKHDSNVGLKARHLPFDSTYAIPLLEHGLVKGVLGVAFDRTVQLTPEMLKVLSMLPPELNN